MLIQHIHTFTYSCKHGNHVRRARNNSKEHLFWRLPALLLCASMDTNIDALQNNQVLSLLQYIDPDDNLLTTYFRDFRS